MNTVSPEAKATSAHRVFIPFALPMFAANIDLYIMIVLVDNTIGFLIHFGVVLIALGYAVFILVHGKRLKHIRFGNLMAHMITYTSISSDSLPRFSILVAAANPVLNGESAYFVTAPVWFGVAIAMPTLWGVGLVLHALGAVLSREFEK